MKVNPIGTPLPRSGDRFLRMKSAGDKVTFRIAQEPVYEGKHFMADEEGWNVTSCPRINDNEDCDFCNTFFAGMAEAKKEKEAGNKDKAESIQKEARKYNCSIAYYFPILNRDTKKFTILQTTVGVKNELDKAANNGVKVFERDWVLSNTGSKSPKDLYALSVVDSADSVPFDADDKAEFIKATLFDTSTINSGNTNQDSVAETEEMLSDEDVEKIDNK